MLNDCISVRPNTIQVYSFSRDGGQSYLLPMKPKRKSTEVVSEDPFYFLEKKKQTKTSLKVATKKLITYGKWNKPHRENSGQPHFTP